MSVSPLQVVSDGYLYPGSFRVLGIAASGYLQGAALGDPIISPLVLEAEYIGPRSYAGLDDDVVVEALRIGVRANGASLREIVAQVERLDVRAFEALQSGQVVAVAVKRGSRVLEATLAVEGAHDAATAVRAFEGTQAGGTVGEAERIALRDYEGNA
jgi:hypothetical protein